MTNLQNNYRRQNTDPRFAGILDLLRGPVPQQSGTPGFTGGTLDDQLGRDRQIPTPPLDVPQGIERSSGQETRPWKVAGSNETNPLIRDAARIRAMIENPRSEVSQSGAVGTVNPLSKKKAVLLGLLNAGAMIRPGAGTAESLAALGTGAAIGVASPRSIQEWDRRNEVATAQGQLAKQQKLGLGQAQIESEQAETEQRRASPIIAAAEVERKAAYDRFRIKTQQQVAEGRISIAEANRQLREKEIELRKQEGEERKRHNIETGAERRRHNVETENISRAGIKARPDKSAETQARRASYESEAQEWSGKESTFRQNKSAEDEAIKTKTAQLAALDEEEVGGTILNRGGRTRQAIDTDKARLQKELETHRSRASHFQSEGDKAAAAATTARRNAGLHANSKARSAGQGVVGRSPARDGKHHYTAAEIRSQAEAAGVSYESLYDKLKRNKKVVIDP